jgi:Fur family ferric uptake transcriptional regulator
LTWSADRDVPPSPPAVLGRPPELSERGATAAGGDVAARVLRGAGLTVTAPRRAVYRVLAGQDRPLSAAEVFDLLRAGGSGLGLPSVYRVLHSFATARVVHVFAGEEQRFRLCTPGPHAHLVCQECGRVIERPTETVRGWLAPARQDADFVADVERTDLYGVCGRCRPQSPDAGRRRARGGPAGSTATDRLDRAIENGYQTR